MVEIPIRDEGSSADSQPNSTADSDRERLKKDPSGDPLSNAPESDTNGDEFAEEPEPIDWGETSKLAEEISQTYDYSEDGGQGVKPPLAMGPVPDGTWPPGTKRVWPPSRKRNPFARAAETHDEGDDDDERVPFEHSTEVGVMHGDQIERGDFEKLQTAFEQISAELKEATEQAKENYELAQRKQAEMANMKRRARQEMEDFRKRAIENLLVDLIPVLDSLEKAVWSVPKGEEETPLADGIRRTLSLFLNILTRYKVTLVGETNVPFDPNVHSCLYFEDTDDYDDNTVLEIYQNGYVLGDRLIRPAMVKLSRKADSESKAAPAVEPETPETSAEKGQSDTSDDGESAQAEN